MTRLVTDPITAEDVILEIEYRSTVTDASGRRNPMLPGTIARMPWNSIVDPSSPAEVARLAAVHAMRVHLQMTAGDVSIVLNCPARNITLATSRARKHPHAVEVADAAWKYLVDERSEALAESGPEAA